MSDIAGRFYGDPSRHLNLIGVTGTNGKTSVTQLVAQALDLLGQHCGIVGTLGPVSMARCKAVAHHAEPDRRASDPGRPERPVPRRLPWRCRPARFGPGGAAALAFDVAVMTNLSRDHLDYHGTMEAYGAEKAKLFAWNDLKCRVVNLDDAFGRHLAAERAKRA